MKDKEHKGEWVQDYTQRGSPKQGHSKFKWRSEKQRKEEIAAKVFIVIIMVLGVIGPIIINGNI
jgi:hypothetical protein